ncbi:hypothetical protein Dimus_012682 [Dionaea muscipula]
MASVIHSMSSCFALTSQFKTLSIRSPSSIQSQYAPLENLRISSNFSHSAFSKGCLSLSAVKRPFSRLVVCEVAPMGKADSVEKRARQNEKRRLRNKSRKSEVKTRMKKVLESLDKLKKKSDAQSEEILPIEKLIAEAYSAIDKAVQVGTLHRNTGARRKSRLARRKKAIEIHHGWYIPTAATAVSSA